MILPLLDIAIFQKILKAQEKDCPKFFQSQLEIGLIKASVRDHPKVLQAKLYKIV